MFSQGSESGPFSSQVPAQMSPPQRGCFGHSGARRRQRALLSLLHLHTWATGRSPSHADRAVLGSPAAVGFSVDAAQWDPRCGSRICNPDIQEETTPSGRTFDQRGGRRFPHLAPRWTVLRRAPRDTSACPMTLSKYHPSPGSGGQLMTRAHTGSLPSPSRSASRHLPGGSHSPSGTCTTPWSQAQLPGEPWLRRWPPQRLPWTAPPHLSTCLTLSSASSMLLTATSFCVLICVFSPTRLQTPRSLHPQDRKPGLAPTRRSSVNVSPSKGMALTKPDLSSSSRTFGWETRPSVHPWDQAYLE